MAPSGGALEERTAEGCDTAFKGEEGVVLSILMTLGLGLKVTFRVCFLGPSVVGLGASSGVLSLADAIVSGSIG